MKSAVLVSARLELGHPAARLLLHMAAEALDKPNERGTEARRFWQGRESQAIGLGFSASEADSEAAHSAVKRALRELTKHEVVELVAAGRFQRASEYYLRLDSEKASPDLQPSLRSPTPLPQVVGERPPGRSPPHAKTRAERLASRRFAPPPDVPWAAVAGGR